MALEIRNLKKSFASPDGAALDIVNIEQFSVKDDTQVAIIGSSGSGKTTLLNLISGIIVPDEGEVSIDGTDITHLDEAKRDVFRAGKIGFIFQTFNLLQGFSALENVLLGMMFTSKDVGDHKKRAVELLERVGLGKRYHHRPGQLSVGEQQRVAIARAVANKPSIILADEPTGSLDRKNSDVIINLIKEIVEEEGHSLVIVSHEPAVIEMFENVYKLDEINAIE